MIGMIGILIKASAKELGYRKEGSYIYDVNRARAHKNNKGYD